MTFSAFYAVGTVSVAERGTVVTGVNTNWAGNVAPGDIFWGPSGLSVRIASVDSATKLTLARPWPGAALNASAYEVWQVLDAVGYQRATRDLLRGLSEGALPPLSALAPETDTVPYFDGPGSAGKTPLTAFAKTLLDDANAAQALATLGVSDFGKVLLATASGADGWKKLGASAGFGGNGWYRFPDGLIIQWGVENSPYADNLRALPIAFPSVNYGVFATPLCSSDAADAAVMFVGATTTTSFVTYRRYISPAGQPSRNSSFWAYWLAIGR